MDKKRRLTPFLILNPIIIGLAILQIIMTSLKGGFGMIMINYFIFMTLLAGVTLFLDRILIDKVNYRAILVSEIILLILSFYAIKPYL